ncbi:MAG: WG repeat-containing protein [Cyclobacteriaceae bacterium]
MSYLSAYLKRGILLFLIPIFINASNAWGQTNPEVFKENDLSGIKDSKGEILVPAEYPLLGWSDGLDMFVDNVIGYYNNNWGIISAKNKVVTSPDYYDLWPVHKDLIIASKKKDYTNNLYYGALDSKGNAVVDFKYSSIDKIANALIVTEHKDGLSSYGLLNEKNKFLLDAKYRKIKHFAGDLYSYSDFNFKTGLINKNGRVVIPLSLDSIGPTINGKARVFDSGKTGLINEAGNILMKPGYKSIDIDGAKASATEFNSFTIVNHKNEVDLQFSCDSLISISDFFYGIHLNEHLTIADNNFDQLISGRGIAIVQSIQDKLIISKKEKFGVLNTSGEYFIPMHYDSIAADSSYFYLQKDKTWSVVNKFGRTISKSKYDELMPVSESLIAVKKRGYWGFIDFQGDEVIANKFDEVTPFKYLTSRVRFLDAYGTINQFGEWICEPIYDDITIHKDGVAEAKLKTRIDLINRAGDVIFQTYNKLSPYDGGFIEETEEGKIGFVMRDGRIVKHPIFDEISFTAKDSILIAKEAGYLSMATKNGDRFYSLSGRFEEVLGISEGFVGIKLDGKYGFVDLEGRLRIANRYDSIRLYSDGMAAFYLRGNWGYIDKAENLRVQPIYESSFEYLNGTAIVIEDGKYGVINKDGKYLLKTIHEQITRNKYGSFKVELEGKFGLYDKKGNKIVSPDYTELEEVSAGRVVVKRRGMYGVINEHGRFTIPMMYTNITYLKEGKYMVVEAKNTTIVRDLN